MTYSNSFKIICLFAFLIGIHGCDTCGPDLLLEEYPFSGKTWEDYNLSSYSETIYYKDRFGNGIELVGEVNEPRFVPHYEITHACDGILGTGSTNYDNHAYWDIHYSLDYFVRYEIDIIAEMDFDFYEGLSEPYERITFSASVRNIQDNKEVSASIAFVSDKRNSSLEEKCTNRGIIKFYDSIKLNEKSFNNVYGVVDYKGDRGEIVYFNKEFGIVAFLDVDDKMWVISEK